MLPQSQRPLLGQNEREIDLAGRERQWNIINTLAMEVDCGLPCFRDSARVALIAADCGRYPRGIIKRRHTQPTTVYSCRRSPTFSNVGESSSGAYRIRSSHIRRVTETTTSGKTS